VNDSYDVVIVGGGPGGYVAAVRSVQLGMKTVVVERERLGGVCLNWGCIPTKALLESARLLDEMRRADEFGLVCRNPEPDWKAVVKRSRAAAARMTKGVEFLLKKKHVEVTEGTASFETPTRIEVTGKDGKQEIDAKNVILATGAAPRPLPGLEPDGQRIITYREALVLPEVPPRLLIIGAGAIGVEFAYLFSVMGSRVTPVEMMENVLPNEDAEVSRLVERKFRKRGIAVHTSSRVSGVDRDRDPWLYTIEGPNRSEELQAEVCLVAVGVQADIEGLGMEKVGLTLDGGFLQVDDHMRTNVPGVWAIGDCTGPPLLAHAASHEGICAIETIAGLQHPGVNRDNVPACTYCHPQVASVGLTEQQAREAGHKVKVGKAFFLANGRAVAGGETDGLVKFVVDGEDDRVLGVHIVGPGAPELIGEVVLGRELEATARRFATTIHAHPTLSEALMEAAGAASGEGIHTL